MSQSDLVSKTAIETPTKTITEEGGVLGLVSEPKTVEFGAKIQNEEKSHWMNGPGKDTYIALMSSMNPEFKRTSCVLTAAIMRNRISGQLWWDPTTPRLTSQFLKDNPTFQLAFGECDDFDEHILTVHNGIVYQSYYRVTEWDVRPFPFSFLVGLESTEEVVFTRDFITALIGSHFDIGDMEYILCVPHS